MNGHRRERTLDEEAIQSVSPGGRLDKDDYLVELKCVKQVYQLSVLLIFLHLAEKLLQTVKRQSCLIVNRDLERLLHELLARQSNLLVQRG